jgi:hypothetical protein
MNREIRLLVTDAPVKVQEFRKKLLLLLEESKAYHISSRKKEKNQPKDRNTLHLGLKNIRKLTDYAQKSPCAVSLDNKVFIESPKKV